MYEAIDAGRIGKRIKELRTQKGITAEELAKGLEISASAIVMYELGYRIPRDEIKIRMAQYFDCTVESIFYPSK